jgi:hypothetical protein
MKANLNKCDCRDTMSFFSIVLLYLQLFILEKLKDQYGCWMENHWIFKLTMQFHGLSYNYDQGWGMVSDKRIDCKEGIRN